MGRISSSKGKIRKILRVCPDCGEQMKRILAPPVSNPNKKPRVFNECLACDRRYTTSEARNFEKVELA